MRRRQRLRNPRGLLWRQDPDPVHQAARVGQVFHGRLVEHGCRQHQAVGRVADLGAGRQARRLAVQLHDHRLDMAQGGGPGVRRNGPQLRVGGKRRQQCNKGKKPK